MKSIGSGWENLKIQLALKGLKTEYCSLSWWEGLRALMILGAIPAETSVSHTFNHAGQVPSEGPDEYSTWPSRLGVGRGASNPNPYKIFALQKRKLILLQINLKIQSDRCERQQMTAKPPMELLSPKACVKIGRWNVRTMYETGKCAQLVSEM